MKCQAMGEFRWKQLITNTATHPGKSKLGRLSSMVFFWRSLFSSAPEGPLIEERFSYAAKNKPIAAGRAKAGTYLGENRKFDDRFRVKCPQESADANASSPPAQLQSIMVFVAVIAYRRWDFRAMDVSRVFLMDEPLERAKYVELKDGAVKEI